MQQAKLTFIIVNLAPSRIQRLYSLVRLTNVKSSLLLLRKLRRNRVRKSPLEDQMPLAPLHVSSNKMKAT